MIPRWRSSGVATVAAIVSGLAPGIVANTEIVGKSTCGNGATGSFRYAKKPESATPRVNSVVATGRLINSADGFTGQHPPARFAYGRNCVAAACPAGQSRDR